MNINRYNYEEYFLLYTDNELSAEERTAVENFVAQNPDLADEMNLIAQSTLQPYPDFFCKKELLFRRDDETQEQLLLFLDNEPGTRQKDDTEKLIAADPAVKKEWELLQKTLLPAEIVLYPHKDSLYKKESSKIRPLYRYIVAAAVLAGIVFGPARHFFIEKNSSPITRNSISATSQKTIEKQIQTGHISLSSSTAQQDTEKESGSFSVKTVKKNNAATFSRQPTGYSYLTQNLSGNTTATIKSTGPSTVFTEDPKRAVVLLYEKVNTIVSNISHMPNVTLAEKNSATPGFASALRNTESQTSETIQDVNDDRILTMRETKLSRTRLGNLFSKVKNAVQNKNRLTSESRPLRIGNLEIAINN